MNVAVCGIARGHFAGDPTFSAMRMQISGGSNKWVGTAMWKACSSSPVCVSSVLSAGASIRATCTHYLQRYPY
jgi:hypothetical protein